MTAMMPLVGGTVDSHNRPMDAPKASEVAALTGNEMKASTAAARRK